MSDEEFEAAKRVVERHGYAVLPCLVGANTYDLRLLEISAYMRRCDVSVVGILQIESEREGRARNYLVPDDLREFGVRRAVRPSGVWLTEAPTERLEEVLAQLDKGSDPWYELSRELRVREWIEKERAREQA